MKTITPGNAEQFVELARRGNLVAVVRTIPADLFTPVSAYLQIAKNSKHSFLLESVEGGEHLARYSFLGADPFEVVRGRGDQTTVESSAGLMKIKAVPVTEYLRRHFRERKLAQESGLAPLAGGAVGYLAYGAARTFEPAVQCVDDAKDEAMFMMFRTVLAFDHARQQVQIHAMVFLDGDESREVLGELYDEAVERTDEIVRTLHEPIELTIPPKRVTVDSAFCSNFERNDFEQIVVEGKELIAAGECYQVVLSQRFSRKTNADAVSIYRALRMTNPSPYMFLLRDGETALIGASPEMLVRCAGRKLEYRPIAGTRPRGADERQDEALAEELLADEKERAEHVMLVDLGRNDLGRVSEYGSVKPVRLMKIEKYSHVQHIVTELTATLRPEYDRFDALAACFPAGTVTGAPKIRAMQAIAELERGPRGVYSGSVLYADYAGNLDSCIAIRTIELRNGLASVQAGAGIVADSSPAAEYDETVNKSRALQQAVALAEAGV